MIASHLTTLAVFSALLSTVFATLLRDDLKSRLRFGIKVFGAFLASVAIVGWLMATLPR